MLFLSEQWFLHSVSAPYIFFPASVTASATPVWCDNSGTPTPSSSLPLQSSSSTLTCTAPTSSLRGRWSWRTLLRTFEVLCSPSLHHIQRSVTKPVFPWHITVSLRINIHLKIEFCACTLPWLMAMSIRYLFFWKSWPRKLSCRSKVLFSCPQQILRVLGNGFMAWLNNFSAYWSVCN